MGLGRRLRCRGRPAAGGRGARGASSTRMVPVTMVRGMMGRPSGSRRRAMKLRLGSESRPARTAWRGARRRGGPAGVPGPTPCRVAEVSAPVRLQEVDSHHSTVLWESHAGRGEPGRQARHGASRVWRKGAAECAEVPGPGPIRVCLQWRRDAGALRVRARWAGPPPASWGRSVGRPSGRQQSRCRRPKRWQRGSGWSVQGRVEPGP